MDTELLRIFLEVNRTRHFGRTTESLYLTQPTMNFRIRQLEDQLGVSLFAHHRNDIRLTTAGEKLLPYTEALMNTWQAARKEVAHASRHNEFSISASASLWECMFNQWLGRLYQNQDAHMGLQFEVRIAQRQSLVKQLHGRQLNLLTTTEAPKMDEFGSQLLGYFTLVLYTSAPSKLKGDLNYLRLEWGPDFQQHEAGSIGADEMPILTTSSARLVQQQIVMLSGCTWLPISWTRKRSGLHTAVDSMTFSRPLYAIWLQDNDRDTLIHDLLKINVLDKTY